MWKSGVLALIVALCGAVQASWYWPFGSDSANEKPKRVSELIAPASALIDEAADLAADGKTGEAVEKYRKALFELDQVERNEDPKRVKSVEFATLRNKRAYVNAAIDSLLLGQVKSNAKAVAVSDTAGLEKRLRAERRAKAIAAIKRGDFATAERLVGEMVADKPNGAAALNLKAVLQIRQRKFEAAEATLDQAIQVHPRSHFAYYNMAKLLLQTRPDDKAVAKRYYDAGRSFGGPVDARLEEAFK